MSSSSSSSSSSSAAQDWWSFEFANDELNVLLAALKETARWIYNRRIESAKRPQQTAEQLQVLERMRATHDEHLQRIELLTCEQNFGELPCAFGALKCAVETLKARLDELDNAVDEEAEQKMSEFRERWSALEQKAESLGGGVKVPWELQYKLLLVPSDGDQVDFRAGTVTDVDGRRINEAICSLCSMPIQHWAEGEGDERYCCMDDANRNHSTRCHVAFDAAWRACSADDEALRAELLRIEPFADGIWTREHNLRTFLRFEIGDASNAALAADAALRQFARRPLFGEHERADEPYRWLSYDDVRQRAVRLALAMRFELGLAEGAFVGICMRHNCVAWLLVDIACVLNRFVSVGLMSSWPDDDMCHVLDNANVSAVFCADDADPARFQGVEHVVATRSARFEAMIADAGQRDDEATFSGISLVKRSVQELADAASSSSRSDQDLVSLIYSSGSTNRPKGIMETEQRWCEQLKRALPLDPLVMLSYAPYAHGMDRGLVWSVLANGGRVGLSMRSTLESDADVHVALLVEAQLLEPTLFAAMPPFWNRMAAAHAAALQSGDDADAIANRFNGVLGSRVKHVTTGGAKTTDATLDFMHANWPDIAVCDSYGLTELPGISQNGQVLPGIDIKLRAWAHYSPDDDPPRGEILARSASMTPGYYRMPEESAAVFGQLDGTYMATGDIGSLSADGMLTIIDRKSSLSELYVDGRSVWIATAPIEATIQDIDSVRQVLVHGDRMESKLIAIVVVDDIDGDDAQLLDIVQQRLTERDFDAHSVPAAIIVERNERWTVANRMLVGIGKLNRANIKRRYAQQIDSIYLALS
jgi:long-subunit acyl-CoA synthetase (AMP-forming)